jgi:hypothetical protein
VNVGLREPENKAEFGELFFDTEEAKVIGIDGGEIIGSMFQSKREHFDLGPFDVVGEIGAKTFNAHPRLFSRNEVGSVFNAIEDAVSDFLNDVVDGNGSAGILETMAAMIASCGRKESAIGCEDVKADKTACFGDGNQGVKDFLIQGFAEAVMEVGEGSLAGDAIKGDSGQASEDLSAKGIAQVTAEIFNGRTFFETAKQIEKKERNRIIARAAKDGIGNSGNGADEGEINSRTNKLSDASRNGAVVVDGDRFFAEFVMGEPAGFFLGEGFGVTAIDKFVAFEKLFDRISSSDANVFAHVKIQGVSRELVPPSNRLPGNPFYFFKSIIPPQIQTKASDSSLSTKAGGMALRRLSCV